MKTIQELEEKIAKKDYALKVAIIALTALNPVEMLETFDMGTLTGYMEDTKKSADNKDHAEKIIKDALEL